jgi:hypothetical protein
MIPIREIRDACTDPSVKVRDLLRKAKVLASTLKNEPLKHWLTRELNGYPPGDELPSYRKIGSPPLGTFCGPQGHEIRNYVLPVSVMPEVLQRMAQAVVFANSIGEIEAMAEAAGYKGLRHTWPAEAVMLLRETPMLSGYALVEVNQPLTKPCFEGILDAVRNRLLDFVLGLQELDPEVLDSEKALTGLAGEQVSQVFNVAVYGDHAVVASGKNFSQTVMQAVSAGDLASLVAYMQQLGVASEDVQDLQTAVKKDGPRPQKQLGERVTAWVGRILTKAVTGTWKISVAIAPELLKQALHHYYGWK